MLCDCIPDDLGHAEQQHLWQLISKIHTHIQVHLIAIANTTTTLKHWRRLSNITASIDLVPKYSLSKHAHINHALQQHSQSNTLLYCQNLSLLPKHFDFNQCHLVYDHSRKTKQLPQNHTISLFNNTCHTILTNKHRIFTAQPNHPIKQINSISKTADMLIESVQPHTTTNAAVTITTKSIPLDRLQLPTAA